MTDTVSLLIIIFCLASSERKYDCNGMFEKIIRVLLFFVIHNPIQLPLLLKVDYTIFLHTQ